MSPTEPAVRQHAATGHASPQLPEPTHAERVRTLMSLVSVATLSTVSRRHPGFPSGSLMPFALDATGRPIFLISDMAMHTQNLKSDPRCSLFVTQTAADGDPLGAARATLVGHAEPVEEDDLATVRKNYLVRRENSRYWVDFADFGFFRLQPIDLYYVGGFGVMGWLTPGLRSRCPRPAGRSRTQHSGAHECRSCRSDGLARRAPCGDRYDRSSDDLRRSSGLHSSAEDERGDQGRSHQLSPRSRYAAGDSCCPRRDGQAGPSGSLTTHEPIEI